MKVKELRKLIGIVFILAIVLVIAEVVMVEIQQELEYSNYLLNVSEGVK